MPGPVPPARPYRPPPPEALQTCFESTDMVAVDKPAGLLSVPGRGDGKEVCALSYACERFGPLWPVHRLDLDTSGLLIFARSPAVQKALSHAFENRKVAKTYRALVSGVPAETGGEIDLAIGRDWNERPRRRIDPGGKSAQTRWQLVRTNGRESELRLEPLTGRTHQLRVHLHAIGHPILGDRLYDGDLSHERLMLHAERLCFIPPGLSGALDLRAEVPFSLAK